MQVLFIRDHFWRTKNAKVIEKLTILILEIVDYFVCFYLSHVFPFNFMSLNCILHSNYNGP